MDRASRAEDSPERRELRVAEQQIINELWFPLIERARLPDDGVRSLTFAEVERYRGIRVTSLSNPNNVEGLQAVQAVKPDLILSIRYGAILKPHVIGIPRHGVLNLHSGLLPAYRGVLATFRALMHGDEHIGCTLHNITDGTIDTGPIVDTAHVPVVPGRSLLWHVLELYRPGVDMLVSALKRLDGDLGLLTTVQESPRAVYYSAPSPEEWAESTRAGWKVVQTSDLHDIFRQHLTQH